MNAQAIESIRELVAREEISPGHAQYIAEQALLRAARAQSIPEARDYARLAADLYDWVMGQ